MLTSSKQVPRSLCPSAWAIMFLLLVVPILTVGPAFQSRARFLPQLPIASAPLATENPSKAAAAMEGMNFSTSDRLFPVLTDQIEARRQIQNGTLPTWDPHLGAGVPLFGASIAGIAYPPNWLALLIPPELAAAPLAMLSLFLAGLGMLLFLRMRGLTFEATVFGAMAMQTSLWGLANLHDFMKVDAALWTPWMLYAIELLRKGRRHGGPVLALAAGLSLLAGFIPIAIFGLATAGVVALVRLGAHPKSLARALGFVVLGFGIGAWQILPMLESSGQSVRQSRDASTMQIEALPLSTSAALVIPDLFGDPGRPVFGALEPTAAWLTPVFQKEKLEAANALEWNLHFGSLALLLALVAMVARLRSAALPFGLLLLWLGFAQGWPGVRWLYHLPGFNLGAPGRAMAMGWPLIAWLSAIGADALFTDCTALAQLRGPKDQTPKRTRCLATWFAVALGLGVASAALCAWMLLEPRSIAQPLYDLLAARHNRPRVEVESMLRIRDIIAAAERLRAGLTGLVATGLLLAAATVFARLLVGYKLAGQAMLATALASSLTLAPRLAGGAFQLPPNLAVPTTLGAAILIFALTRGHWRGRIALTQTLKHKRTLAVMLFTGLCVEALGIAPAHLAPRIVIGTLLPESPAIRAVAASTRERNGRVLRLDQSPSGVGDVIQLARPNLLAAYDQNDLTPYMVFTPRTLVELVMRIETTARFRSGIAALHDPMLLVSPLLDLLRVDTVLSRERLRLTSPRLELTFESPGFHVYHRSGSLPEALLVGRAFVAATEDEALAALGAADFNPRSELWLAPGTTLPDGAKLESGRDRSTSVTVSRPSANKLDAKVASKTGGWLLFTEQFAPDWKVSIDGKDTTMLRADHALRALWIAPGEHLVRTWYEPWSLRIGCCLMLLSLAVLCIYSWYTYRKQRFDGAALEALYLPASDANPSPL